MDGDKCHKIVELFEQIHARPVMYTGKSYDFEWMIQLIRGFYLGLEIMGETVPDFDDIKSAYLDRGWSNAYFGAVEEMKSKGLEGDEITREIISVQIDLWKNYCKRSS